MLVLMAGPTGAPGEAGRSTKNKIQKVLKLMQTAMEKEPRHAGEMILYIYSSSISNLTDQPLLTVGLHQGLSLATVYSSRIVYVGLSQIG